MPFRTNLKGRREAVDEMLKDVIARHVFHPLQGMTFGDWWALLRRHRFAVDLKHSPRALVQSAVSAANSVNARIERLRFGERIDAALVHPPLFILGHYLRRAGLDPRGQAVRGRLRGSGT
jgi:hypothetical protein